MLNTEKQTPPQSPNSFARPKIRVLIVDDSVVVRKILTAALRNDPDMEVVGSASNGLIALQRIGQFTPDVVTLDIEMPELDGIDTVREIKRQFPKTKVIMCSTLTERGASVTLDALALGADDYVTKPSAQNGDNSLVALIGQLIPKVKQFSPRGTQPRPIAGRAAQPAIGQFRARPRAIAIGVSTGGPSALAEVIPALPVAFPLPVFIVQHMPPMFTRLLAERLQTHSKVPVVEASEGMQAVAGQVYIAPGDHHMCVAKAGSGTIIHLNQEAMENSCRPAVDVLFRSVGEVYGGATISVILTGMGQDGLRGVETLRGLGGYVIAQDEASSVVWGMPGLVARAGLADAVCDLKAIAPEIVRHLSC
ncbi:MAG: chemotaxis response regulator protein-glutamate methylesterase [Acidobacteria bacterium]|nr:chemotaxis response regulator protein-glutamate methylesterase [Acidobacteriota bacterium]